MEEMKVLNEEQSAKLLGCSVALMRKWRLFREGPSYVKIGRLVRYRQEDLNTFLDAHLVETGGGR
jgi:predicted DNA-binding transcriptional regulator AlpA